MIDFAAYDAQVLKRLEELLSHSRERLPVGFRYAGRERFVTDSPISLIVEPVEKIEGLFDCSKVFEGIQAGLNAEFAQEPAYQPITLLVPLEFLGRNPVTERLDREADIRNHRSVRLRKESHG